ncbi:uncharacterized protein LOC108104919 [Drosophila eugracilis]|uniref:uncharacterized protein LOC108104919 n=1 Tax=Drosophila eugracilis TaxID=29029 RepID=UPI0007E846DB|nr:uncharacterized protein LOC108104919 [Drosophila eugracilis]
MSKATKLRFALITEDVLDKLRPRSQSENGRSKEMSDVVTAIRTAVNEVVNEKLQQLSNTIDQMVEESVSKTLDQQNLNRALMGGSNLPGMKRINMEKVSKVPGPALQVESSSSLKYLNTKRRRPKKNNDEIKGHVTFAQDEHLVRRPRAKAQKITVMPIHCENQVKTPPPSSNNPTPLLPPQPSMDHKALKRDDDDEFSDMEDPSILTIAAKYLKKLEESRRRKQQQLPSNS